MIANSQEKQAQTQRMIEHYRAGKSLKEVAEIMDCRPRTAPPRPPALLERTKMKVRRARKLKSLGWKQRSIATELGLTQSRVSQMLGEAPEPQS